MRDGIDPTVRRAIVRAYVEHRHGIDPDGAVPAYLAGSVAVATENAEAIVARAEQLLP